MLEFALGENEAIRLDNEDKLSHIRKEFIHPQTKDGDDEIYLCGHSLGLQPKRTKDYIVDHLDSWAKLGVKGHFEGKYPWMPYHEFLLQPAANLVGALTSEVIAMNSLTANIHLMMVSFFKPHGKKTKILIEKHAFPSDRFAVASQLSFHGLDPNDHLIELEPKSGSELFEDDDIAAYIEEHHDELALVLWPGVQYYTGQAFDLKTIANACQKNDVNLGVDLAHAAGNIPLSLHDWGVDFAVWCHYKYLNSGPGAVGGCFVHEKHTKNIDLNRFAGWWGFDKTTRFQMASVPFKAMDTAEGWQLSNPPIISLASIRAAYDVVEKAGGIEALREKSLKLTGYLEFLIETQHKDRVRIITPKDPKARGAQLSIQVQGGKDAFERLSASGITCDWREPGVMRIAPVPSYNSYRDVYRFVKTLEEVCYG
jgi:kynureninase